MIRLKTFILFLFLVCFANYGMAQTNHSVSVGNNFFSPASLTITQGDIVTWTNGGGFHNVNASTSIYPNNPVGFTNGAASTSNWTYSFTFNTVGTYTYQCDPHAGGGMIGTITVNAPAPTPLCGTYNVGGAMPDYPDLVTAVADLAANGVSCAVTFNVAAGGYTGAISIPEIAGASATNTITIDGGNAATTSIFHSGTAQNAVILLDSANHVTIKNLTLHHPATAGPAWGVRLNNDANYNTIDNCIITLQAGLTGFQQMVGVLGSPSSTTSSTAGSNCNHLTISNNQIIGGYYAIRMEGGNNFNDDLDSNIVVTNNIMDGNAAVGIFFDDIINLTISGNNISGHGLSFKDGMDLNDVTDFYITSNTVNVPDYGIDMDDGNYVLDSVLATGKSTIINNMLLSTGEDALNLDDVGEIDVFHNTCVTTTTAAGRRALRFNDDVNLVFKNNIFVVDNGVTATNNNQAVWINDPSSNAIFDYNIYHTLDTELVAYGGSPITGYTSIAAWQSAYPAINQNSIQGAPVFMSATDLHINPSNGLANGVGDNSVGVMTDIDGDTRPLMGSTIVDIGADEYTYTPPANPVVGFAGPAFAVAVDETVGSVTVDLAITAANAMATSVDVSVGMASTADASDYTFTSPTTVTFPASSTANQSVTVMITDDMVQELDETIVLKLSNTTNGATINQDSVYTITINLNDVVISKDLVITGVFDGPLSGGTPKGIELYVINNIPELAYFGLGSANNGGGSDGQEFTFPSGSATAGDYIYLTTDSAQFNAFFGFNADYIESGASAINGDDAVELFEGGQVIDVFGDINMDGTGTAWDHVDGWAYRNCGTGPDSTVFQLASWSFSGPNVFDGQTTNATTPISMPIGTYSPVCPQNAMAVDDVTTTSQNTAVTIDILVNDNLPNPLDSIVIVNQPTNGTVMVNGIVDVTYTPNAGFCGSSDIFVYAICDLFGCDTATVTVTVNCPTLYPFYTIAQVHTEDMNGVADSLNVLCELRGVVYGIDMDGNNGISFTIRDNTGGINVFNFNDVDAYVVTEGDSIHVKGDIGQYNGLTQIMPDSIQLISSGNPIKMPTLVTMLDETTESDLIRLNNLTLSTPSQWPTSGNNNVDVTDGTNTFTMRIDGDTDINGTPAPTGTFDLIGIGGQFDGSSPHDAGYQIFPRGLADILPHPVLNPIVQFSGNGATVNETVGSVSVDIMIASPNANMTSVDVSIGTASTATSGVDYTFTSPTTVTFPASSSANQMITVTIIDDALIESSETIVLELSNPTNGATLGVDSVYTITINDDDSPIPTDLIITGVFDATLPGGLPKGIELYALTNIPDLSVYGFGSANNGGGSDGQEFTFPAVAATAGQFIYVATDTAQFSAFFGFHADYEGGMASSINGDDAIELFGGGQVIDVFGDINVDGNGEPWEYADGWAYRKCATGPDDSTFVLGNWIFSGIDVFDGQATNATTPVSMPVGTYNTACPMNPIATDDLVFIDEGEVITIDILTNDNVPNPLDSIVIVTPPIFGSVVVNGIADVTYTPNPGACDLIDDFYYAICDATGCDTALVEVDIACLPDYPYYPIATVHTEDADGIADSLAIDCELRGVVYCGDFDGNNGYSFTMIDPSGGINVFNFVDVSNYVVAEGDSIHVFGVIENYNGLTEIVADSIELISSGNTINPPTIVTALDETTESQYIKVLNLTIVDPTQWLLSGSFNVDFSDGTNTYTVRVDADTDISGTPAPTVAVNITGIGGQFDNSVPHTDGYQLFPCSLTDIVPSVNTNEVELAGKVRFFPNPANATLHIQSEINIETIRITNVLGQEQLSLNNPRNNENIDVSKLVNGVYFITFVSEGVIYTEEIVISH